MSLSDLASLGSFVSGIAVLVSLIFLYFQLRQLGEQIEQGEKNQRAALNERYASRGVDFASRVSEPSVAELRNRVYVGDTKFNSVELVRLRSLFRASLLNIQDVWVHHNTGLIDQATFDTATLGFKSAWLAHPVFRALWLRSARAFAPEFRAAVDAMIREIPIAKPSDLVAQFNADLATVTAAASE